MTHKKRTAMRIGEVRIVWTRKLRQWIPTRLLDSLPKNPFRSEWTLREWRGYVRKYCYLQRIPLAVSLRTSARRRISKRRHGQWVIS